MKKFLYSFLIFLVSGFPLQAEIEKRNEVKPVVIIGGGVGALTSAIYLQRAGIDTLVIEGQTPGGSIAQSPNVHNWPGELEISGQDLVDKIRKQAEANGATIVTKEVTHVDFSKAPYSFTLRDVYDHDQIETIRARSCIVAVGSKPNLLGVPGESGEKGYWTRGVYSCAVCDGGLYKNKTVAVVGGGDAAILEADYLSKIAKKVYVILRSDEFRTIEALRKNELVKKSNVEILYNTKVNQIQGDGQKVTHLNLSTSKELPVDGVFVAIGAKPNSEIFTKQIDLDQNGYIRLIRDQQTSTAGVFAIGDVVDPVYKQAISAAGDGAKAAFQVEHFLASEPANLIQKGPEVKMVQASNTPSGKVEELSSQQAFYESIGTHSTPIVVDFYSPLCGPCKQLAPQLDQLATTYKGKIRFLKVNVTEFTELADSYNVFAVPTVVIFDTQGKMIDKGTGVDEINRVLKKLDKIASK